MIKDKKNNSFFNKKINIFEVFREKYFNIFYFFFLMFTWKISNYQNILSFCSSDLCWRFTIVRYNDILSCSKISDVTKKKSSDLYVDKQGFV